MYVKSKIVVGCLINRVDVIVSKRVFFMISAGCISLCILIRTYSRPNLDRMFVIIVPAQIVGICNNVKKSLLKIIDFSFPS